MNDFKPFKSVGFYEFGSVIEEFIKTGTLVEIPEEYENGVGWKVFKEMSSDNRIYTENNLIVSITIHDNIIYNGKNLIGMTFDELLNHLQVKPDSSDNTLEIDDEKQTVYEFESLGAQVWVNNQKKVVTVICSDDS